MILLNLVCGITSCLNALNTKVTVFFQHTFFKEYFQFLRNMLFDLYRVFFIFSQIFRSIISSRKFPYYRRKHLLFLMILVQISDSWPVQEKPYSSTDRYFFNKNSPVIREGIAKPEATLQWLGCDSDATVSPPRGIRFGFVFRFGSSVGLAHMNINACSIF